ncbi:replicative DNA helicase [Rhodopirellula sallentina]|nr:DnaB-like helicase C-terminal domain-containing protein [Rhodopirellula sallentina]
MKSCQSNSNTAMVPQDSEAEMGVIGAMLLEPTIVDEILALVRAADFHVEANQIVFHAISLLRADCKPIDITLLTTHLRDVNQYDRVGGGAYLAKLSVSVASVSNAPAYARIVADRAKLRRLIELANETIADAVTPGSDPITLAETMRAKIDQVAADASGGGGCMTLHAAACQRLELLEHPEQSSLGPLLPSGIGCLDDTYGGFRCGGSYVIAARPGKGKSALMKQIANALDLRGRATLVVSLEMEEHEIAARILSERLSIDGKLFEVDEAGVCQIPEPEMQSLRTAVEDCKHSLMRLHAPKGRQATIGGIAALARLMKAKYDIKVVAIDYLQLIHKSDPRQSDYETVTECSKACKQLARELGVVVLLLSQLNRDSEKQMKQPRRPRLSDLRDSGSIEQDADGVIFLHQPNENSDDYELVIPKWRNDSPGMFNVRLVGEFTKFDPGNYHSEFCEYSS